MAEPVRVGIVGAGGFARYHLRQMLQQQETTQITAICEPLAANYTRAGEIFSEFGLVPPPNQPDFAAFLNDYAKDLDAALIVTPHVYHHDQTKACLEAGLDVLLEKPMVLNAAEAESLIAARDRTGRLLVVAFPGSLSPQVRTAARLLHGGDFGELMNISATVWQNWKSFVQGGQWRGIPAMSGGGFLFDTGAHMLNTIADLAGQDFAQVAAWMDNRGQQVDILSTVMGRLKSGAFVTMNACGDAIPSCESEVLLFCSKAIVRTGIWGERLEVRWAGRKELHEMPVPPSLGVWEQFVAVRAGHIPNPSPPEVGLRMARLWDAIRASAAQDGAPIRL